MWEVRLKMNEELDHSSVWVGRVHPNVTLAGLPLALANRGCPPHSFYLGDRGGALHKSAILHYDDEDSASAAIRSLVYSSTGVGLSFV